MPDIVVTDADDLEAIWLKDLAFHRLSRPPARLLWFPEHALHVFTELSRGQLEWTTVADLRKLTHVQDVVTEQRKNVEVAQVRKLQQALSVIPDLAVIAEALSTTEPALQFLIEVHANSPRSGTSYNIEANVTGLAWSNPLIQFWELQQLAELYQASWYAMEDTACDLIVELWATRPLSVLADAAGCQWEMLAYRVHNARSARGVPGDPRRLIRQRTYDEVPLPLRNDSTTSAARLGQRKRA